jgi:NAD(P)H dehydrogenase (quinone)
MKASVIIAHPYTKSFNHAIYQQTIQTLESLKIATYNHDLYKEKFNPVLTKDELGKKPTKDRKVKRYVKELIDSDLLVFIHPNWWGQSPAILKGYIDRVIRPPHAYEFNSNDTGGGIPLGKLTNKIGLVINTSNTEELRENEYFHDPLQSTWDKCVFGFCGITSTYRKVYRIISDSSDQERKVWLKDVEEVIRNILKEKKIVSET